MSYKLKGNNNSWVEYRFSDFVEITPTVRLKKNSPYSFIKMEDLSEKQKYCIPKEIRIFNGSGTRFQDNDTLFARITPCLENGKICQAKNLVNSIGFGSTEFHVFRGKSNISDTNFVFYLSKWNEVKEFAEANFHGTSGRQRVPKDSFDNLIVKVPPLPEQRAIATALSSLDDKIDLLHRQNKTLEAMAETLFRQWFVEEADERWEKGKIPDEFDYIMGVSPPGESYNELGVGIPMYQGNADFEYRFPKRRIFTTDPKRFAQKHDTLISVRAPVGAQNMADEKCCIGRGLAAFRYKRNKEYYSYTYFKMKSLMNEIEQFNQTGTVFGSISKTDFEELSIIIPSSEMVDAYQKVVKPVDDKIISNCLQIRTHEKLRDTLLPKLMSGEVRVKI